MSKSGLKQLKSLYMKIKKITLLHVFLLLTSYLLNAQYNFGMIMEEKSSLIKLKKKIN